MPDEAQAGPDITVADDELDPAEVAVITDGLRAYDLGQAGHYDFRPLAVFVRDPQTGKVVGGLHGRSEFRLVYVAWFFLPEDLRRARIGSRVLAMAEEEGRRRGCTCITTATRWPMSSPARSPSRSAMRSRSAAPAPAPSCRAACRMPGRAPAWKPGACCFSIRRPGQAG